MTMTLVTCSQLSELDKLLIPSTVCIMVTAKNSVWHHINSQSDDSERACSADGLDLQVASSLL